MSEIETPDNPSAINQIAPEDLAMDDNEILEDAQGLATNVVRRLPENLNPAQERALVTNSMKVYRMASGILNTMLEGKKGQVH